MLVSVVEHGSLSTAAQKIGLSPAAVSRGLAELEQTLGARLLHRSSRKLTVTESGARYVERCRRLLEELADADSEAAEMTGSVRGTLRVNVPESFGILRLADLWAPFLAACPDLRLEVTLSDRVVDLLEAGCDFALRIARLADSSVVARQLACTRLVLCAAPDYVARCGAPRDPADLVAHRCLLYVYQATRNVWQFKSRADGAMHSVPIRPVMTANNGDVLRAAALGGAGIALAPTFLVGDDLAAGRLVELLPGHCSRTIGIYGMYPTRRHVPLKTRRFLEFLTRSIGTDPAMDPWDPAVSGSVQRTAHASFG